MMRTDPFLKEICSSKIVRNSLHYVNSIAIFLSADSNTIHFLSMSFLNPLYPDSILRHFTVWCLFKSVYFNPNYPTDYISLYDLSENFFSLVLDFSIGNQSNRIRYTIMTNLISVFMAFALFFWYKIPI